MVEGQGKLNGGMGFIEASMRKEMCEKRTIGDCPYYPYTGWRESRNDLCDPCSAAFVAGVEAARGLVTEWRHIDEALRPYNPRGGGLAAIVQQVFEGLRRTMPVIVFERLGPRMDTITGMEVVYVPKARLVHRRAEWRQIAGCYVLLVCLPRGKPLEGLGGVDVTNLMGLPHTMRAG